MIDTRLIMVRKLLKIYASHKLSISGVSHFLLVKSTVVSMRVTMHKLQYLFTLEVLCLHNLLGFHFAVDSEFCFLYIIQS